MRLHLGNCKDNIIKINEKKIRAKFNTTLKINKSKRLKHFKILTSTYDVSRLTLPKVLTLMSTEHYFDLWSKFGSDCSIKDTESCPYCLSNSLCPEYSSHGHSINGYLPGNRSCYVKCLECGLVTSIKRINDDDLHMIYDDYLSEKKVHKQMNITEHSEIKEGHMFYAIAEHLGAHSSKKPFKSVSDLGGKDGLFFNFLKHFKLINDSTNKLVCDFFVENEIKAELSVKGIGLIEGDIIDTINQVPLECQLYTIFEVIEHIGIEKLEILLQKMFKIMSSNNSILAISTPDF